MASSELGHSNTCNHHTYGNTLKDLDNYSSVQVCTGNLLLNDDLKRKIYNSSTEEFIDSILWTLEHVSITNAIARANQATEMEQSISTLIVDPGQYCNAQLASGSIKTTCKLFPLNTTNNVLLEDAISSAFKYLNVKSIDLLILSPSSSIKDDYSPPRYGCTIEEWQLLEKMVDDGLVKSLGTSDFDLKSLQYLTETIRIRPVSNQINKQMCCSISPELTEYAEKNSIQLLTHNDRSEILNKTEKERLEKALGKFTRSDHSYRLEWLLRYSVMIGSKGLLDKKGYLANFKKVRVDSEIN